MSSTIPNQTAPAETEADVSTVAPRRSRPHIYALDPLRATTAFAVVAVHTFNYTAYLNHAAWGLQMQNAILVALHYTREFFMFVTAFALVYVYFGKPLAAMDFWRRRAIGVLIPYCLWTMVYVLVNDGFQSPGNFLQVAALNIFNGKASYQLYFILLSIQFYIFFPLFLPLVKVLKAHPWKSVAISGALEVVLLFVDYHTVQRGVGHQPGFWLWYAQNEDSILFVYQFYFVLGAVVATHFDDVRAWLLRHGAWVSVAFAALLAALFMHFYIQVDVSKDTIGYATSVLQPIMVFYSVAALAFFFWLAMRWARQVDAAGHPAHYRVWRILSDASFGVYLIHALALNWLLVHFVPTVSHVLPVAVSVMGTWLLTVVIATAVSILLMNTPVLSRLVGRSRPLPQNVHKMVTRMRIQQS